MDPFSVMPLQVGWSRCQLTLGELWGRPLARLFGYEHSLISTEQKVQLKLKGLSLVLSKSGNNVILT